MNEREKAICSRVRDFRHEIKWPQPAFAQELGLSRDQLASIEYGRTPLRFGIAANMAWVFDINLEWLVTGNGPRHAEIPPATAVVVNTPRRDASLLSQIYDQEPNTFIRTDEDSYHPALGPTPGFEPVPFIIDHVIRAFQLTKFRSPYSGEVLARGICNFCDACLQQYRRGAFAIRNKSEILGLPSVTVKRNLSAMNEMQELISRIARATRLPGRKTELANALGVPSPRVSEWLRKDNPIIPSGDTTLRLLRWVEQQERKQESPGRVSPRPEPKTQARKSKHENQAKANKKR